MLILGTAYAVFNSNPFQNWLTGKLGNYLSAQFKTKISIGHINYKPLQTFELQDVLFGDHKNDTLFFCGSIDFKLAGFKLDSTQFRLSDVKIDRAYCNVVFYKDNTFNIDVLFNILDPNDTLPSNGPPFVLYFDKVKLTNTRFRFRNETDTTVWENFAANDQLFYNINADADDFYIIQDSLHFNISHLDLMERSGFKANHIKSLVTISPSCMLFDSLELKTPYTHAKGFYGMRYKSYDAFSNFYDDVKLDIKLQSSVVDGHDVAFFAAPFEAFPLRFKLQGQGKGTVSNLQLKNLDVRFGKMGQFRGKAQLNGLPNVANTLIDAEVTQLLATQKDIEYLAQMPLSNSLDKFGLIRFDGTFTGFYQDFVAYGNFHTALGTANTDINMKISPDFDDYTYSGNVNLVDFDLGKLTEQKLLGKLSTQAKLQAHGIDFATMEAQTDATISRFDFNGYAYHDVKLKGSLNKQVIQSDLVVDDEHLTLDFKGSIDLSEPETHFKFNAFLANANLQPLGFDTMDLTVGAQAQIDFAWRDLDHNKGSIALQDISIARNEELFQINHINFTSSVSNTNRVLKLNTDNITAEVNGQFNILELKNTALIALHKLIPEYFTAPATRNSLVQNFSFSANVQSLYPFNNLYFSTVDLKKAVVSGDFNETKQVWNLQATADNFKYDNLRFTRINITHDKANLNAKFGRFLINDTLFARDASLQATLAKNVAQVNFAIKDSQQVFSTQTQATFVFKPNAIEGTFDRSTVQFRKAKYIIKDKSILSFKPAGLVFTDFSVRRNVTENILVNGLYSYTKAHQLKADLTDIKLDVVNDLLPDMTIKTNGLLNGEVSLTTKNNNAVFSSDALLTNLSFDNDTLGDFKLLSNYVDNQNRLMAFVRSVKGKLRNLEVGGYYDFNHINDALNFNISFDESDVSSFQPFVKDYIKIYSGNVSANGQIAGSLARPEVNCKVDLMGVTIMVDYLKTMYSFSTSVQINEQQIKLAPTEIRDINDRRASLSGSINHKYFKNFTANLALNNLHDFQLLNTKSTDNDLFYGTAYADGDMTLTGPFTDLLMDAKFTAKAGTVVNIPLSTTFTDGEDGLIHFVNKDTVKTLNQYKRSGSISGFAIKCMMHVTPKAELNIVMDEQQGDKIRGRGQGDILLELTRTGQFNMYGEVEVNEGDYAFTAMNLFTKKFTLKPGGKITWTGDPFGGQMNIVGAYNVRTTVADVVATATNAEREMLKQQRVPVECLLYVKGSLLNPDIKFDMNINDINGSLPGNTISELQNNMRIWRSENDLMVQQVISLLLFGRFTPTNIQNSTGPANLTAGVNNTLSGFVSSQATNFIQRIIPGFDLNVDYHTGNESVRGRSIVTGTKRVFDNRLEIQASFDPINTYQNFLTQYNLTRDGSIKAKAFSRAQLDPIYNRNINTNGVGLYYRKEFDTFKDLFTSKKK